MSKYHFIINLLVYQLCWFACVLSAAGGMPWIGTVVVVIAIAYHLSVAVKPIVELTLIICVMAIGGSWDSFLVAMDWLIYPNGILINGVAPYWIISLWVAFATTLNVSLVWFKQRLWLSSLFGGVGGPLAFFAGERLGAVQFSDATVALSALAVGWALLMPLMMLLSRRWNGFERVSPVKRSAIPSMASS